MYEEVSAAVLPAVEAKGTGAMQLLAISWQQEMSEQSVYKLLNPIDEWAVSGCIGACKGW